MDKKTYDTQEAMSTEERIKQEAELIPEKLGWVNDGTSEPQDIKRAYALGALSERNKVIEEVKEVINKNKAFGLIDANGIIETLESLKV